MPEDPPKPKWYLNPDGTFPTDADGKPMFVSEALFKGCCCNMCQWRRKFEWDCEEGEWVELDYGEHVETDGEWIPAEHDPGESDTLCIRTVWGEIVNCLVDPKPEPPTAPTPLTEEEIEECCPPAPCACPCSPWPPSEWPCEGLLEQYSIENFEADVKLYSEDGCTGDPDTWRQRRSKLPIIASASNSMACLWSGFGVIETRFYDFENNEWQAWTDEFVNVSIRIQGCKWLAAVGSFAGLKSFGKTPTGSYSGESECGGVPPGTTNHSFTVS